jgi:hypothetical protein
MLRTASHLRSVAAVTMIVACDSSSPTAATSAANRAHVQEQQLQDMVTLARCLRTHGFPNFPDPNATGELTHEMLANAGIDLHQPAVLQAADACVRVTNGLLSKAAVARFVAGQ